MMTFLLESSDGLVISVEEDVAFQSKLLEQMVRDTQITGPDDPRMKVPLTVSNISGEVLKKIMEWCTIHRGETYHPKELHEDPRIHLSEADINYMNVDSSMLLAILLGANFLDIQGIIDIVTQKIADMANGKSVEEIREIYGLINDFTPEEEEEIRKRFEWIEG